MDERCGLGQRVADEAETHDRWAGHPLAEAAPLIHDCLSAIADEQGYLIVVSDAAGLLMSIEGSPNVRLRAAADMNFAEGTLWSEPGAGTNAIGTALAVDHAVQVFGPEHYSDPVQRWTCSAAPIHDPDTGELIETCTMITTDASGNATIAPTLKAVVANGQFISATATAPDGSTSEFSNTVPTVPVEIGFGAASYSIDQTAGSITINRASVAEPFVMAALMRRLRLLLIASPRARQVAA